MSRRHSGDAMAASTGLSAMPWFHRTVGRMETEKLLLECRSDGAFLIRESDTVRGAYVLSTIYQQRIHHYRILPDDGGLLSIQAQQGVQRKLFGELEDLVQYYSQPRRGLVCGLTTPISQQKEEEPEDELESDPEDEPQEESSRGKNVVSKFLLASLGTVDTSCVDDTFLEHLRSYLHDDVSTDVESMVSPIPQLTHLKQLFSHDCEHIHKQLDKMMAGVDIVQTLFERAGGAKISHEKKRRSRIGEVDMDGLILKLRECSESLQNLETTAFQMLKELSVSVTGHSAPSGSLSQVVPVGGALVHNGNGTEEEENDEEVSFDVKIEGVVSGKKSMIVTVKLREGRLTFCKPGDTHGTTFEHHQVLQLVKSRSKQQKVGILLKGLNRKDYIFGSMQAREHFCQLVQLIRNRLRSDVEKDSISVFVGTWNMGDAAPPASIASWFRSLGQGKTLPPALAQAHDIYALGTQECSISDREWTAKVKSTLKQLYDIDYEKVAVQTLWGIRILIFVKPEHSTKISHLQVSQVRTGIGNALGNKGAVGISFHFGNISLCFINSHLTSGIEKCARRNQNYHDILKGMSVLKHKKLIQYDLTNQFTHMFFFGDLNYRVDLSATDIIDLAKRCDHHSIYLEDQLRKDQEKKKIFVGFEEAPILFPPTYRFAKNRRTLEDYVWVKQKRSGIRINVPSYCDRVLWRSYPGTSIGNTSYGCTVDVMTSDHSPVFATFQIGGVRQYVSDIGTNMPIAGGSNTFIVVDSCKAKIQTNSRTYFYVEVHSTCFEGAHKSGPNNEAIDPMDGFVRPVWCGRDPILKIKPIVTEPEYLEQQHVLIIFKSLESDEPYAECCISLRDVVGPAPVSVQRDLIHQGLFVGKADVWIHVTLDHYKKVEEDQGDIYTDLNFITAELEESSSLDFVGRGRYSNSESDTQRRMNSIDSRPKLPAPRSGSFSEPSVGVQGAMASAVMGGVPPPVPKRRDTRPPAPIPYTAHGGGGQEASRPSVPARRSESFGPRREKPVVLVKAATVAGSTETMPHYQHVRQRQEPFPPIPFKRKTPPITPRPNSATTPTGYKPSSARVLSKGPSDIHLGPRSTMGSDPPPIPPKSPEHGQQPPRGVPLRPTHAPARPRPLSTVERLLESHGLQHFAPTLIAQGYDDIHFVADISDEELQEVGISNPNDRTKILRVFSSYGQ